MQRCSMSQGPVDVCVERLAATMARTGARCLQLVVEGVPEHTEEVIEQLGVEVLPALTGAGRPGRCR